MVARLLLSLCLARHAAGQLRVVGAGLPKTGTESLAEALAILGYGWNTHGHCNWPSACQQHACDFLEDGNATLLVQDVKDQKMEFVADEPLCLAYKELMDAFPEAKVVLSVRDSPEAWFKSFALMQDTVFGETVPKGVRTPHLRSTHYELYCDQLPHIHFDCDFFHSDLPEEEVSHCKAGYSKWNEEVQRNVPKEKLLVFNVKEGWGPLCKFLGKPVPNVSFPYNNTHNQLITAEGAARRRQKFMRLVKLFGGLLLLGLLLGLCLRRCKRKEASD